MEESNGPRLFVREWISILTTSNQHRIHSKLRFRKNMPFSASVRYLFLRHKSATKAHSNVPETLMALTTLETFHLKFSTILNQGLRFDVARLILKHKTWCIKIHSR